MIHIGKIRAYIERIYPDADPTPVVEWAWEYVTRQGEKLAAWKMGEGSKPHVGGVIIDPRGQIIATMTHTDGWGCTLTTHGRDVLGSEAVGLTLAGADIDLIRARLTYMGVAHAVITATDLKLTYRAARGRAWWRAQRTGLGFSVRDTATYFRVSEATARDWDKGTYIPPDGVLDEMDTLAHKTRIFVHELGDYHVLHPSEPLIIPRTDDQLDTIDYPVDVPAGVTVGWWKNVAARISETNPFLHIEWPT